MADTKLLALPAPPVPQARQAPQAPQSSAQLPVHLDQPVSG